MTYGLASEALDAAFHYVADRADALVLCDGVPASGEAAVASTAQGGCGLGAVAMSTGVGGGDYCIDAGEVSGRRLSVAAQHAVPVSGTGLASHVALVQTSEKRLLLSTRLTQPIAVVEGGVVALEGFDHEIEGPSPSGDR